MNWNEINYELFPKFVNRNTIIEQITSNDYCTQYILWLQRQWMQCTQNTPQNNFEEHNQCNRHDWRRTRKPTHSHFCAAACKTLENKQRGVSKIEHVIGVTPFASCDKSKKNYIEGNSFVTCSKGKNGDRNHCFEWIPGNNMLEKSDHLNNKLHNAKMPQLQVSKYDKKYK